jgi:hypothetical protein
MEMTLVQSFHNIITTVMKLLVQDYILNLLLIVDVADECALLVPKNRHVKAAAATLRSLGLPVISEQNVSLSDTPEAQSLFEFWNYYKSAYIMYYLQMLYLIKQV